MTNTIRFRHLATATLVMNLAAMVGGCVDYKDLGAADEASSTLDDGTPDTSATTTSTSGTTGTTSTSGTTSGSTTTTDGTGSDATTDEMPSDESTEGSTTESSESSGSDGSVDPRFTPENCTEEAIDECYDAVFADDACGSESEDLCDEVFACDVLSTGCDPTSWDEYEDWEQLVIFPLTDIVDFSCGERLQICMGSARTYCELTPDACANYVQDCRGMYDYCLDYDGYPAAPEDCPLAEPMCRRTESAICEVRPEQCDTVSAACDAIEPLCDAG